MSRSPFVNTVGISAGVPAEYKRLLTKKETKHFPHNHLQSLLDGFIDFSRLENSTLTFKGLSINSKKVHEDFLFLACSGVGKASQHGIAYAGEAINSGASCVVWEPTEELKNMPQTCPAKRRSETINVPLIPVVDLQNKVGEIAARFYQHPSHEMNVIGITGTNGKTSTAHFIAQLLESMNKQKNRCAVVGTLGNGFYGCLEKSSHTTPDAVTLQTLIAQYRDAQAETLVMEVSSHALSQGRVKGVEFNCAILTNLTRDHLDYHGDMTSYANEKLKLFHSNTLQHVVLNGDDEFSRVIIDSLATEKNDISVVRYSCKDASAEYYADSIELNADGIRLQLHYAQTDKISITSSLISHFNIENLLAAIAALHRQGHDMAMLVAAVEKLKVVPGRMEKIQCESEQPNQALIVVDYAHTPDALNQSLKALKAHTRGKLVCLFGCGGDRDKGKRPLMAEIAQQQAEQIIVTSDNPRSEPPEQIMADIITGFEHQNNVVIEQDRAKAIQLAISSLQTGDALLIAGKGSEDYQEINGQRFPFSDKAYVLDFLNKSCRC